jgi:hypothetical protein
MTAIEWIHQHAANCVLLAAFPRSGVTLTRTLLHNAFGLSTASVYVEQAAMSDVHNRVTGHIAGRTDLWGGAIAEHGLLPIKTHDRPDKYPPMRVLGIVRDGRRVYKSLHRWNQHYNSEQAPLSVEQLIRGEGAWGSWSDWIKAWADGAVFVRFEDILADRAEIVRAVAGWLDLEPACTPEDVRLPTVEELRHKDPGMFHQGHGAGTELTPAQEDLFWSIHGEAMETLGYVA